jgi:hypothetical protein
VVAMTATCGAEAPQQHRHDSLLPNSDR